MMKTSNRKALQTASLWVLVISALAIAGGPPELKYGESYNAAIPEDLKAGGSREAYFYTHGPVTVYAYAYPCVVTIRDPDHPEPPVASGSVDIGNRFWETDLPAGFYYISVTNDASVLVGVSSTDKCNGFYHYRSSGEAYGDSVLDTEWYFRATDGCENSMYLFSPSGSAEGYFCYSTICLEKVGSPFSMDNSDDYFHIIGGDTHGYLEATAGGPVMILSRDDSGYFVPPYNTDSSSVSRFYTTQGLDDNLNVHSFADGTEVSILNLQTIPPTLIWSGTLDEGETYTRAGAFPLSSVVRVHTTKGQASVSVIGGSSADDTDYMSYVLDQIGNMQGSDFITPSHTGGFIYVTGLEDDTHVEVRDSVSGALQSTHLLNQAQILNVNPGIGTWRIRADQDITLSVGKGHGGTFVPMTKNTSGSTPYPPVIAGVNHTPRYPRTSDSWLTVTWLTDELASTRLNYRIGAGPWLSSSAIGFATQHQIPIDISSLSTETVVRYRPEATDQSGMTTVDDNGGADYLATVVEDAPDLAVEISSIQDHGATQTVRLNVSNNGAGDANDVVVKLRLYGMQPYGNGISADYTHVTSNRIDVILTDDSIASGGTSYLNFDLKPYLASTGSIDYRMSHCTTTAEDDWGHFINQNHPGVVHDWDDAAVEAQMVDVRYVVLANLQRFFAFNPQTSASSQAMPLAMGAFANRRDAALAYVHTGDCYAIRDFIQGRFNGVVDSSWFNAGYLLLVGCSGVMPAFGWHLHCTWMDFDVDTSDNTYANIDNDGHFTPELIVGRITGDNADNYTALFDRATSPISFEKAMAVSGTGDGEGTFSDNASDCRNRLAVRYPDTEPFFRLSDYASGDRRDVYVDNCDDVDFLYYRNHGNVWGWDSLDTSDLWRLSFGTRFPIVYSNACLTGAIHTAGNFAEEFLARHAAVFIGATEVSPRDKNNQMGNSITASHRDGNSIGRAFRDAKRSLAGDIHWYTTCWQDQIVKKEILMYNLYGDPFRGGYPGSKTHDKALYIDPPDPLSIVVPHYEVTVGYDGFHHVTIPDPIHGAELQVINEPIVPVYRWIANFRPGVRVNNIALVGRSIRTNQGGLNLPTAWWNEKVLRGPSDVPSPGTFPPDDYHWTAIELPDGGLEVVLTVHPFFYNAETRDATFYQNFTFDFDIVSSSFSIGLRPLANPLPIGSAAEFEMVIMNQSGEAKTVNVDAEISDMGSSEIVETIPIHGIAVGALNTVTTTFSWDPATHPQTHYQVTAPLTDALTGDELDVGSTRIRVGNPALAIAESHFNSLTPGFVGINEDVAIGATAQSVGDIPASGTAYLRIRRTSDGLILYHREESIPDLAPPDSYVYGEVWNSSGIEQGDYVFQTWIGQEGGASIVSEIPFQTKKPMRMGWWMQHDVFGHGDPIIGTCDLYEDDGTVIGPGDAATLGVLRPNLSSFFPPLNENVIEPHYFTSFIVPADQPSGPYALISTANKLGYQPSLGGRWFVVTDDTFGMQADPAVGIADGVSSVTVTTEGLSSIPDGTLMTVTTWGGTVANEDADPVMAGIQVAAEGGEFTIGWRSPPNTVLDAFLHGTLGAGQPQSGVSLQFKGIDFNGNRRVDVSDLLFVQDSEGALVDTPDFDIRKDLNNDRQVSEPDTHAVLDRWALELEGAVHCPLCPPATGTMGVRLKLIPDKASIPPGGNLAIEIVAEGVLNLAGYEFGMALDSDAVDFAEPPAGQAVFGAADTIFLGPIPGDPGYHLGAFSGTGSAGPTGRVHLAWVNLQADHLGESQLILSSPVFCNSAGFEQHLLQADIGVYRVEVPIPTPTVTQTPTATATPIITPTPTGTPSVPGDMNDDGVIDGWDCFYFSLYWKSDAAAEERCNMYPDDFIDAKDLLEWMRLHK